MDVGGAVSHATAAARSRARWHLLAYMAPPLLCAAVWAPLVAAARTVIGGRTYFTLADDPMISMQYARNLAAGHGLVWNPGGPHVEGYTNFLWTLWLAVLHLLPIRAGLLPLLVMVSGFGLLVANLAVVRAVAAHLARGPWTPLAAAAVVAAYYPLDYWTARGFEVGAAALVVSILVLLVLRLQVRDSPRDVALIGAVAACGLLIRDDLAVPAVVAAAFAIAAVPRRSRLQTAAVLAAAVGGTLVAHTIFRLAYYGEPLPNTYYLKVTGVSAFTRLHRGVEALSGTAFLQLAVPIALAVPALAASRRRAGTLLLAATFGSVCLYSAWVGGDAWELFQIPNRYLTTAAPMLLVLAVLGVEALAGAARRAWAVLIVSLAAAVCAAWPPLALHEQRYDAIPRQVSRLEAHVPDSAIRFAAVLGAGVVIALGMAARRRGVGTRIAVAAGAAALALSLLSLEAVQRGGISRVYLDTDAGLFRFGLALNAATRSDDSIAFLHAGSAAYFSRRTSIDLLGKSDQKIAHGQPATTAFLPGHTKWNYAYSIGVLHPTVVAETGPAMDVRLIEHRYGYRICFRGNPSFNGFPGGGILVRRGSDVHCAA